MSDPRAGWVAVAALLAPVAVVHAEDTASLRFESGADYDTNATREESGGPADGVLRMVSELRGSTPWGSGARLSAGWHGGGKLHMDARGEDVIHQKADLSVQQSLGRGVVLGWDAGARDRTSRAPVQSMDHTRLHTGPGLETRLGALRLGARGLFDRTNFKPDADLDADALGGHLSASWLAETWSVQGSGMLTRRTFTGPPTLVVGHDGSGVPVTDLGQGRHRLDEFRRLALETQYGGDFLLSGEAAWERNASNSLGGSLTRATLRCQATTPLPYALVLTAGVTLQRLDYDDPQFISETQLIEDEGRSALALRLERPVSAQWAIVAHGSTWFSPAASEGRYLRTVTGVGLSYLLEP